MDIYEYWLYSRQREEDMLTEIMDRQIQDFLVPEQSIWAKHMSEEIRARCFREQLLGSFLE